MNDDEWVRRLYDGFNRRDIPAILVHLKDDVAWANGMDGGHVQQWAAIAPQVDPLAVARRNDGSIAVEVHQVVRDLKGNVLLDETVRHVFQIAEGLVVRFDIENAGGLSTMTHD
jgi:ketosteroid isomerase-like protein